MPVNSHHRRQYMPAAISTATVPVAASQSDHTITRTAHAKTPCHTCNSSSQYNPMLYQPQPLRCICPHKSNVSIDYRQHPTTLPLAHRNTVVPQQTTTCLERWWRVLHREPRRLRIKQIVDRRVVYIPSVVHIPGSAARRQRCHSLPFRCTRCLRLRSRHIRPSHTHHELLAQ